MHSRILQQLLGLRIVIRLDFIFVHKVLFDTGMVVDLETLRVECVVLLMAGNILDYMIERDRWTLVRLWLSIRVSEDT